MIGSLRPSRAERARGTEMERPPQTKEQPFEIAIVDGINIFVREVLAKRGFIDPEKLDGITSREVLDEKYRIARELARAWAKMPMTD
jgi:hypothetical protein